MKDTVIKFKVKNQFISVRTFAFADKRKKDIQIIDARPYLCDYRAQSIPTEINPRSHGEQCLKSSVAKDIRHTLANDPEAFMFANRGSLIVAKDAKYDKDKEILTLTFDDFATQGIADGATTDAVIGEFQNELLEDKKWEEIKPDEMPEILRIAQVNLVIYSGLKDRDLITQLVEGRNNSRNVKGWSMTDFRGGYDWIKEILENNSKFAGKIGYDENAGKNVSIIDVLALLNLFHPSGATVVASYGGKGKLHEILQRDEMEHGFKQLAPILPDIIELHDYVYANYEIIYEKAIGKNAKLGKRSEVKSKGLNKKPWILPLTETPTNYDIPNGLIFPLLASMRALVSFGKRVDANAKWVTDPKEFFDKHGVVLMKRLFDLLESFGSQNRLGKDPEPYRTLFLEAKECLAEENQTEEEAKKQLQPA